MRFALERSHQAIVGAAVAGFALGFLAGIPVGAITTGSLREAIAQRDRLRAQVVELSRENEGIRTECSAEIASALAAVADASETHEALGEELRGLRMAAQAPVVVGDAPARQEWFVWRVSGTKTTETFRINSRTWRVSWHTLESDFRHPYAYVIIHKEDGGLIGSGGGSEDDSTIVRAGPGRFYLELSVIGGMVEFVAEPIPDAE